MQEDGSFLPRTRNKVRASLPHLFNINKDLERKTLSLFAHNMGIYVKNKIKSQQKSPEESTKKLLM